MSTNFFEKIAFSKRFLAGFVLGIQRLTVSSSPRASLVMKEVGHGNDMLFIKKTDSISVTIDKQSHWFQT